MCTWESFLSISQVLVLHWCWWSDESRSDMHTPPFTTWYSGANYGSSLGEVSERVMWQRLMHAITLWETESTRNFTVRYFENVFILSFISSGSWGCWISLQHQNIHTNVHLLKKSCWICFGDESCPQHAKSWNDSLPTNCMIKMWWTQYLTIYITNTHPGASIYCYLEGVFICPLFSVGCVCYFP